MANEPGLGRMQVALISVPPLAAHGWSRYTFDLAAALAAQDIVLDLITSTDAPDLAAHAPLPLRRLYRVLPPIVPPRRFTLFRLLASLPRLWQILRRERYAAVHIIVEPYGLAALAASQPTFFTAHGTYLPLMVQRRLLGPLYRAAYRRGTIICVSGYTARRVNEVLPRARTIVIPNGVDVARFQLVPDVLPEKQAPTILAVGQVKARKGFHLLAEALPLVRAAVPDAVLVVVGNEKADPPYIASIQARLAALGLTNAVHWLGRVSDETLLGWYHVADVFALPSLNMGDRFEGFGLAYLEASAAGLPVVGTRDCGAEEAIRDGETGLLVPQNDPTTLAGALIRLLQDSALRERLGRAGAAHAAAHTWDRVAREVIDQYRRQTESRQGE